MNNQEIASNIIKNTTLSVSIKEEIEEQFPYKKYFKIKPISKFSYVDLSNQYLGILGTSKNKYVSLFGLKQIFYYKYQNYDVKSGRPIKDYKVEFKPFTIKIDDKDILFPSIKILTHNKKNFEEYILNALKNRIKVINFYLDNDEETFYRWFHNKYKINFKRNKKDNFLLSLKHYFIINGNLTNTQLNILKQKLNI